MMTDKKISAVICSYKDEGNIQAMYERLTVVFGKISADYEIIFVNDASPDNSETIFRKIAENDQRVTVMFQSRNFGAQAAFSAGMEQALGDVVILMDGDLQDPPELIPAFIEKWQEGFDVVYGIRKKREASMSWLYQWLYHLFYVIFRSLSYIKVPLDAGEFSLMDRRVVNAINGLPERDRLLRGLRAWVGFKQTGVEYVRPERHSGTSNQSIIRNLRWARKAIFSFSYAPLEWISLISGITVLISLLAILFYVGTFFWFPDVPRGFTTVFVLVLFIGSIQIFCTSVIAEYIGRIFEEVKQRHKYITDTILNDHRKK